MDLAFNNPSDERSDSEQSATGSQPEHAGVSLSKAPEVTAYFWIAKALTTGMGESTSDFLVHKLVPEFAVVLGGTGLVIALWLQFAASRYVAWRYWLAVAMAARRSQHKRSRACRSGRPSGRGLFGRLSDGDRDPPLRAQMAEATRMRMMPTYGRWP